ncbi:Putative aminotransferase, class-I, pyridoxal-phosphate-binding, aminotransferase, class I/classII [Colletotrichum destructivum]|uniref:Aminotransferase, class-I, pyridoxal-phosphate-binding, aminotransferase, class I/classII n=1 Tax=Colletotrichum destructivum TaxID=34406 RepID=A0AAX4II48_9PEZI|nr:Putative aminotransferase, class-I, pyridoxal-phosphate-binding, aminotransferase, class I/classII [Colletotrichum destructivum]
MVQIKPFVVEEWMDRLETTPGALNIAETCCESVSIQELTQLSTEKSAAGPLDITTRRMTYGAIYGSETTRQQIANLYDNDVSGPLPSDQIILTQGAILANFLTLFTLVGPKDHVVCVYPTYQQLYEVPKSLGADVTLWKLSSENGYIPDVRELESLVRDNTKMIIINNPNNPTGATIPLPVLENIVAFAKLRNIIVMADEVYRPLFHSLSEGESMPPSILSLGYDKTISTGSMSKAFSLAGIRLGWIASRDLEVIEAVKNARNYTTISVSQLDDRVAGYALSDAVRPNLLKRNTDLARNNLELLDAFVRKHSLLCSWVKPTAGTTAMIRFEKNGKPVRDDEFCLEVLKETGVLIMPGSTCFGDGTDFEGHMRFGYVCRTEVLKTGLEKLGRYLENFSQVVA